MEISYRPRGVIVIIIRAVQCFSLMKHENVFDRNTIAIEVEFTFYRVVTFFKRN